MNGNLYIVKEKNQLSLSDSLSLWVIKFMAYNHIQISKSIFRLFKIIYILINTYEPLNIYIRSTEAML